MQPSKPNQLAVTPLEFTYSIDFIETFLILCEELEKTKEYGIQIWVFKIYGIYFYETGCGLLQPWS